jgi:hypothetical protein
MKISQIIQMADLKGCLFILKKHYSNEPNKTKTAEKT